MADLELIDKLIATYRILNHDIRPLPEAQLREGNPAPRRLIQQLRDQELRFSQDMKARISGQPVSFEQTQELAVLGTETDNDSTQALIAQFGTARESTLSLLRGLADEQWDDAGSHDRTIRTEVSGLVERDQAMLNQLGSLVMSSRT
jgi:hypothetical protein